MVELQLRHTIISEDRVKEASKNGMMGYNIIETLAKGDDIRFTEAAVQAIVTNFNGEIMKLLLDRNDDIEITH